MSPAAPTRERLLQAALELTREGGYAGASVAAIAARAGVANGALYRHWPSKGELFAELLRSVCARELAAMDAAGQTPGTAVDRIDAVIATFAARAQQSPRLAWMLLAEPLEPLVEAERLAYRYAYRAEVAALLRAGVKAGELPPQDVTITAAALVGAVSEALIGPISLLAEGMPQAEVVGALRTFARRAIGVEPTWV